ncbi:hypothetical protein CH373_07650 [Leptospira perolatii]|uniref:Uncharacterized protein n=1 Tax=Leptospira perolatii TaxID=2023191 RepID=A0A2M9ZPJ2_9LEPT|nr:hypothetical protein [Leptospira perolatii]PJZ70779.1 hypothetical protein CH360_04510 [Leptospira perolatii]PJZ73987.1 hypothetical protein CH373_07650 [Leptospira perolatii]
MNKRYLIYGILAFLAIVLIYLFLPTDEINESSSVLQGGLSEGNVARREESIFESQNGFLDFSGSAEEGSSQSESSTSDSSNKTEQKSYWDKLSPAEKTKLYEQMYERFKPLAEKFPNNKLIPRKLSQEETDKRKEEEDHYYQIQGDLLERREVSKDDMSYYLDTKLKKSDDMLEVLRYGFEQIEKIKPNTPGASEYINLMKERLESIEKGREEVLEAKKKL